MENTAQFTAQLLTRKQAATLLNVHVDTIDAWRKKGLLPSVLKGQYHYFDPTDLASMVTRKEATSREKAA